MGKKFGFLVIIIGKTCYRVKIGDDTWEFVDTYDPGPYDKNVIMAGSTTVTGAQSSQLEPTHIWNLNTYEQLLGSNIASRDRITGAINRNLITSLFDDAIGYEEHYPIEIITFLRDWLCLKFDNIEKLKPQAEFTMP